MADWDNDAKPPSQGRNKPPLTPQEQRQANTRRAVFFILLSVFVSWLMSGVFALNEKQQAVILRMGKFHRMATTGLNLSLPYPFESRVMVSFSSEGSVLIGGITPPPESGMGEAGMLTSDGNIVDLQLLAHYRMRNVEQYLQSQASDARWLLQQTGASVLRTTVAGMSLQTVSTTPADQIAQSVQKQLQATLDAANIGIEITGLSAVTDKAQMPAALAQAQAQLDEAAKAKATALAQARAQVQQQKQAAQQQAQTWQQEAENYQAQTIATAKQDAARFAALLPQYRQAPDATQNHLYLSTMQQVMSGAKKVVLDSNAAQQPVYLWQSAQTQAQTHAQVQGTVAPPSADASAVSSVAPAASDVASGAASASAGTRRNLRSRDPEQWRSRN